MHTIQTVGLCKRFRQVHAVRDVNLNVEEGSVYALMGPNGAGKTTLIKLLMNLTSPTEGRICILGEGAYKLEGKNLEKVGYVSENQKPLNWMTVSAFLAYCRPFYPTWDKSLESQLVSRFGLPLKRQLKHLSRGERMKAALTSALAFHPKLIILDEPLSGLDPLVRDDLMESLKDLAADATVLLSSHDLAEIESFASHVGYMDQGRLMISEPMARVQARFVRIRAVCAGPMKHPASIPGEWFEFKADGNMAQWRETTFDAERSPVRAQEVLGRIEISVEPLTLREVFLTMARINHPVEKGAGVG